MTQFIHLLDLIGVAAFAATGALVAGRKDMDLFGGVVLAFVTGIGGGTMRDLILDVPVTWLKQTDALMACIFGFVAVYLLLWRFHSVPKATINLLDLLGLALFTILGAQKTLAMGLSPAVAVMMGVLTGCGGGLIRDVLANDVPMILTRGKLYATASLTGAIAFVLLYPYSLLAAISTSFALTAIIRLGSLFRGWRLPHLPK